MEGPHRTTIRFARCLSLATLRILGSQRPPRPEPTTPPRMPKSFHIARLDGWYHRPRRLAGRPNVVAPYPAGKRAVSADCVQVKGRCHELRALESAEVRETERPVRVSLDPNHPRHQRSPWPGCVAPTNALHRDGRRPSLRTEPGAVAVGPPAPRCLRRTPELGGSRSAGNAPERAGKPEARQRTFVRPKCLVPLGRGHRQFIHPHTSVWRAREHPYLFGLRKFQ